MPNRMLSAVNILALDASTEACSVALSVMDEVRVNFRIMPRGHARHILAMVDTLLAEAGLAPADLDLIAYGRGPGSFTGVRIGTGVAQGVAFGVDRPVAQISTLAALAQGAVRRHGAQRILAAIDARMGEVYWAGFEVGAEGLVTEVLPEAVSAPELVAADNKSSWWGIGTGWGAYGDILAERLSDSVVGQDPESLPSAEDMLPLARRAAQEGHLIPADQAMPIYLRNRVTD